MSTHIFYLTVDRLYLCLLDEDKARDREARSSGRNTPTRRTPRGSRERLSVTGDATDNLDTSAGGQILLLFWHSRQRLILYSRNASERSKFLPHLYVTKFKLVLLQSHLNLITTLYSIANCLLLSASSLFNRSARGTSPSIRSELFSPHRRSPSVDGVPRSNRLTESR